MVGFNFSQRFAGNNGVALTMDRAVSGLRNTVQRLFDRLTVRFSENAIVNGLWVGVATNGSEESSKKQILRKVCEALRVVKAHDPYRYRMIYKELDRIVVDMLPNSVAMFRAGIRWCVIDPRFVVALSPESLAAVIVHEATHGRLIRRNIGYDEKLRRRVEKVCMRQELAFAKKISSPEELIKAVEERLEAPPDFWTDAAFRTRNVEGVVEGLRYLGAPEWFIRGLLGLNAFRMRIQGHIM